jgi:hypothetical protein
MSIKSRKFMMAILIIFKSSRNCVNKQTDVTVTKGIFDIRSMD